MMIAVWYLCTKSITYLYDVFNISVTHCFQFKFYSQRSKYIIYLFILLTMIIHYILQVLFSEMIVDRYM